MKLTNPESVDLIKDRNQLLQSALREPTDFFKIEAEYPIVLNPSNADLSYCLVTNNKVIAHANLWPRVLYDSRTKEQIEIGLIGNVATDATLRGQGLMRTLMTELKQIALSRQLKALVLWSDLSEFYQKLGFRSFGREHRFLFDVQSLSHRNQEDEWTHLENPSPSQLSQLLAMRSISPLTLKRSISEFRDLLKIPETLLFTSKTFDGYVIIGKGMDMFQVVHEWAATNPNALLKGVAAAAKRKGLQQVLLLAPGDTPQTWLDTLRLEALSQDVHPMALIYPLDLRHEQIKWLEATFIWGLDSI